MIINTISSIILPSIDIKKHIWITVYNRRIPVNEMTTNHIKKCIACWNGVGNMIIPDGYLGGKEKWLKIFNSELLKRQ